MFPLSWKLSLHKESESALLANDQFLLAYSKQTLNISVSTLDEIPEVNTSNIFSYAQLFFFKKKSLCATMFNMILSRADYVHCNLFMGLFMRGYIAWVLQLLICIADMTVCILTVYDQDV